MTLRHDIRGSYRVFRLVILVVAVVTFLPLCSPLQPALRSTPSALRGSVSALSARVYPTVITPIGPFAATRSPACAFGGALDKRMTAATDDVTGEGNFMVELQRMTAEFSMSQTPPDPSKVAEIVTSMEKSHNDYVDLLSRLKLSSDFQSLEYYALTVSHLKRRDTTIDELNMCVRWQIDSMKAYSKQVRGLARSGEGAGGRSWRSTRATTRGRKRSETPLLA